MPKKLSFILPKYSSAGAECFIFSSFSRWYCVSGADAVGAGDGCTAAVVAITPANARDINCSILIIAPRQREP
jgi:hypothetical protein